MKIALIDMANLRYMPYVRPYLQNIDPLIHEIHIINWAREANDTTEIAPEINLHSFAERIDSSKSLRKKVFSILAYRKYLRKTLKEIAPDFLIVHYQTTGLLIFDQLCGKYKKKYILDYRDITYERNLLFRKLVHRMIKKSKYTFVSSVGFRKFFPDYPWIYSSHNVDMHMQFDRETQKERLFAHHHPIRIAFWGKIRDDKTSKAFVENVAKNKDFELHYYGVPVSESFAESLSGMSNVFFHGSYTSKDREKFAENTDLLLNAYDKDDKNMPYATSNKYYDGLSFFIPQICSKGSVMAKMCEDDQTGIAIDIDDKDFMEQIETYYDALNREKFVQNCERVWERIKNETDVFSDIVNELNQGT